MKYVTDKTLRDQLRKCLADKGSHSALAKDIGISLPMLSMLLNPRYPFTGKAVRYLGYKKVSEPMFERTSH